MSCRFCRLPARGIRSEAMASKFQNLNDLWNHRLAQVSTLLQSPELQPGRKWIKLVDLVEELDWADFVSNGQEAKPLATTAEASPAVVAGAGFVGGGVGAPPTHQTPQSTNVLGGIAQMPAAAANSASGSVPCKEAIIEANRRAALATRAIKQAQAVAAVPASLSHSDLMSQLG